MDKFISARESHSKAEEAFNDVEAAARSNNFFVNRAELLAHRSAFLFGSGDYDSAFSAAEASLESLEESCHPKTKCLVMHQLARMLMHRHQFQKAYLLIKANIRFAFHTFGNVHPVFGDSLVLLAHFMYHVGIEKKLTAKIANKVKKIGCFLKKGFT